MAAKTIKGTAVTGQKKQAKTFKIKESANKGDHYQNTQTGDFYDCTEKTDKNGKSKWKYVKTNIVNKPSLAVKNLSSPARKTVGSGTRYMAASWKIPGNLVSDKEGDRATGLHRTWTLGIEYAKSDPKDPKQVKDTKNETSTSMQVNLDNLKIGSTTYTRGSFYPAAGKPFLKYVSFEVRPFNNIGNGKKKASTTTYFKAPRQPSIGFGFDKTNGVVTATITTNAGTDLQERYDTRYIMTVTNTRTGLKNKQVYNGQNTSTSFPLTYDASGYRALDASKGEYIQVTVEAWARGYAGDSAHTKNSIYVAYPAKPTITGVNISGKTSADKCVATINTNTKNNTAHPVDQVELEYLANVSYAKASDIPASAAWSESDIVDNANCSALAMPINALVPDAGMHTWLRVKAYHLDDQILVRYSDPMEVKQLFTPSPTAATTQADILSATPGGDGTSVVLLIGWNADGQDEATGTEISWSEAEDAWRSTEEPDTYQFTWSDGAVTHGGTTYHDSATLNVKDLGEGTTYYFRARRYLDGDTLTYSNYSSTETCVTSEIPEAVVATCDSYLPTGSSLPVYWTFSGNGLQKSWQIVSSNGTIIADGTNSQSATQITSDRIMQFATNNALTFTVQVSTGSGYVISDPHTVTVIDPPTLAITVGNPLTVQPMAFTATASSECDLTVIVTSNGTSGQFPEGLLRQTVGDTVYSAVLVPTWTAGQNNYSTTVTLPGGLDFWDRGNYTIEVVATDRATALQSAPQTAVFAVEWAHQAVSPADVTTYVLTADTEVDADNENYYEYDSETQTYVLVEPAGDEDPAALGWYVQEITQFVTLTPIDEVDADGRHVQAVQISLTPPTGSAQTDVYDIYRVTGDGAQMIGEGFPLTFTAVDYYAPFGDDLTLYYRLAIRTTDGDVEFADIAYAAEGGMMRFDWAGGSLELPYDIEIGDTYKKDIETRAHMDGQMDGYWNQTIERTASLNSRLIRLQSQEDVLMVRALARYAGPVFVRLPDGSAYTADVQVSDMSTTGLLETIAIDATEIRLADEYRLPTPFSIEEEEP